jgi:hypothetical protein
VSYRYQHRGLRPGWALSSVPTIRIGLACLYCGSGRSLRLYTLTGPSGASETHPACDTDHFGRGLLALEGRGERLVEDWPWPLSRPALAGGRS